MANEIDLAWAAGFVDGEGSLTAYYYPDKKYYNVSLSVGQVNKDILLIFVEMFGGRLYQRKQQLSNGRPIWIWSVTGESAEKAALLLYPYLKLKKRQCELLIQIRSSIKNFKSCRNNPIPENVRILRENIVTEMKSLNRRGIN